MSVLFVPFLYILPIMFFFAWDPVWVMIFISVGGQQWEIVFELQLVSSVCGAPYCHCINRIVSDVDSFFSVLG